jgi:TetR/AcrR family transcriptional regulator, mexJK operon transcriptional repressor
MPRIANPVGAVRDRIRAAAFSAFMEKGYAGANTREIAARAKVSKQKLYELYQDKDAVLADCIKSRAERARRPLELRSVSDAAGLKSALEEFGTSILLELSQPNVVAVFRLGVIEAQKSPQVGRTLDALGKRPNRKMLSDFLLQAQRAKLLAPGNVETMVGEFFRLLWGDTMLSLLLGTEKAPSSQEARARAREATTALLSLHAPRGKAG